MSAAAASITNAMSKASLTVHRNIAGFRSMRKSSPSTLSVGFVPTMGALHDGHLSLVEEARIRNDIVVASIFVNPTQFGINEDLDKYPKQEQRDIELLTDLGVDHLFAPTDASIMYSKNHTTFVDPGETFEKIPEGVSRPGHFKGVATIVTKLFNIVQPTRAYFGQKDAAQCCLIRRIVSDLNMDIDVVIMDTIREDDGLAMSSRNAYLTKEERLVAPIVYKSLCAARDLFESRKKSNTNDNGVSSGELILQVNNILKSESLVSEIQYITVDNKETMEPMIGDNEVLFSEGAIVSLACKVGSVRLIDNIVI